MPIVKRPDPPPVPLPAGPWRGVRDNREPSTAVPELLNEARNVYPRFAGMGARYVGRPGFRLLGAQGGAGAVRLGQRSYQFRRLDGTERTLRFVDGTMQVLDWTSRTWATVPLAGGAGLSSDTRVFCTTFADRLVVNPNDGLNRPWQWDGTTFQVLANAPLAFGAPAVYYGKLFLIKWQERTAFAWSEEGDAATGYEAGGYNNAWTFSQSRSDALYHLLGTNAALYVWRERALEYVEGEVSENFRTTGTRAGISETTGTRSPDSVVLVGQRVFFLDADGHPQCMTGGALIGGDGEDPEAPPIWHDCAETTAELAADHLESACGVYFAPTGLVLLGVAGLGATVPNMLLAFDAQRAQFVGVWDGFPATSLDMVKGATGTPTMLHLDRDGYAYEWGQPEGTLWVDELPTGTVGINHLLAWFTGYDELVAKRWARVDVSYRLDSDLSGVLYDYTSAAGNVPRFLEGEPLTGGYAIWGRWLLGVTPLGGEAMERHQAIGLAVETRWIRQRIRHTTPGEQFALLRAMHTAHPVGPIPATR